MRLTMVSYALVALLVTLSCLCAVNALSVTRGKEPDIFTTKGTTQSARQKVCTRMKGSCRPGTLCMQCNCPRDRPTFIPFRRECVKDQEVREIFDSSSSPNGLVEYLNATIYSAGKPLCQSKRIPTIAFNNQIKTQRKRLAICKGNKGHKGALKQSSQATVPVLKCTVTDVKYLNESTNRIVPEEEKGKSTFTFFTAVQEQNGRLKLFLKWRSAQKVKGSSSLVGTILLILFNCQTNKKGPTTQLAVRLIVKIAGQKQWDVFTTEAPTASEAATAAAMRRASSVTVSLSVVGSLVVLFSICGVAFLLRRRQRKRENAAAKERSIERSNQTNPTYGRDSNIFKMNGERSVADSEEDSAYESVTQNTQATSAQTTYETPQDENVSRNPAEEPIFAPDTNKPQETTEQESQYQPLFKQRTVLQDLDREKNQDDTPKTERDYAVLEDPSEDPDGAAGDPVYHVVEQ